jgi:two-component system sensor histidine kinase SenX3
VIIALATLPLCLLVGGVGFVGGSTAVWIVRGRAARPAAPAAAPEPPPEAASAAGRPAVSPPSPPVVSAAGADTPGTGTGPIVDGAFGGSGPTWPAVVDKLALGVVVMTKNGEIRYRNPQADAMAGTHTGLLIDNAVKESLGRALEGEQSRQQLDFYGPPQVAVVVAAEPLPHGAAVATIEDVSERRRLDAVRTDFVANISHELKTPVGALAVLADAMTEEDDLEVVHRVADRMVNEAHRVARTIDDLMELSRIELGEEPRRDPVSVRDVVDGAIERVSGLAEAKRIAIAVLDVPDEARIIGDRRQLVSALGNLVENAVKYSEAGSDVQVRVNVDGAYAELMVVDRGIGIPEADHHRVFERFYRVDKARSRDTGGTGLGLSIVRHVATNHRGEVLVSSQEGEGSTFVLRIPVADTAQPMPPRPGGDRGSRETGAG